MPIIPTSTSDAVIINAHPGLFNLSLFLVMFLISLGHMLFVMLLTWLNNVLFVMLIAGRKERRRLKFIK